MESLHSSASVTRQKFIIHVIHVHAYMYIMIIYSTCTCRFMCIHVDVHVPPNVCTEDQPQLIPRLFDLIKISYLYFVCVVLVSSWSHLVMHFDIDV